MDRLEQGSGSDRDRTACVWSRTPHNDISNERPSNNFHDPRWKSIFCKHAARFFYIFVEFPCYQLCIQRVICSRKFVFA